MLVSLEVNLEKTSGFSSNFSRMFGHHISHRRQSQLLGNSVSVPEFKRFDDRSGVFR